MFMPKADPVLQIHFWCSPALLFVTSWLSKASHLPCACICPRCVSRMAFNASPVIESATMEFGDDDKPRGAKYWLTRAHQGLRLRFEEEDDDLEVLRSKLVVFMAAIFCGLCGIMWSSCYWFLHARLAACFPILLVLLCAFTVAHLLRYRTILVPRSLLCHGLAITAIGIHWSFGGSVGSSGVASWAILAPQLLRMTGASIQECVWQLAILFAVLVGFAIAEGIVGASTLTPQQVTIPTNWGIAFSLMNVLCPGIVSFLAIIMMLDQLQDQKDLLAQAMHDQTKLNQKLDIERKLAYQLVTHSFPEVIANEVFKFFQSVADDKTRLRDFLSIPLIPRVAPPPEEDAAPFDGSMSIVSQSSAGSRRDSRSGSMVGEYFSAFGGRNHPFSVIMFADIVGFTALTSTISPARVVHYLDILFGQFDELCLEYNVEKIKTIGDCYMLMTWPEKFPSRRDAAKSVLRIAHEMHTIIGTCPLDNHHLLMRIGIHCGQVVGGIIGKTKFCYDIWGDTVNVASRMESTGQPGHTQVSDQIQRLLKDEMDFTPRGEVDVKGKGKLQTYLVPRDAKASRTSDPGKLAVALRRSQMARLPSGISQVFENLHIGDSGPAFPTGIPRSTSRSKVKALEASASNASSSSDSPRHMATRANRIHSPNSVPRQAGVQTGGWFQIPTRPARSFSVTSKGSVKARERQSTSVFAVPNLGPDSPRGRPPTLPQVWTA